MNHRERFLRVFQFKEVDRVPDYEFGYWTETIDRWHNLIVLITNVMGIKIIWKALRSVKVNFATWWEDMCYNRGSLLSVRHFEEYVGVASFYGEHNVYLSFKPSGTSCVISPSLSTMFISTPYSFRTFVTFYIGEP